MVEFTEGEHNQEGYNPIGPVRRDFDRENIYREKGRAIIDDPDLQAFLTFLRGSVREGSLLNLGAGSTHWYYMPAVEDKVTCITAFDLSAKNIQALREFYQALKGEAATFQYAEGRDVENLKTLIEAIARYKRYGQGRTPEGITRALVAKSLTPDGKADLIVGDYYDLDRSLGDRKFDNIMMTFAIFAPQGVHELTELPLFKQIRNHLNPQGRLIIIDFQEFTEENIETFGEDPIVTQKYHTNLTIDQNSLRKALKKAGFESVRVRKYIPGTEGSLEKEEGMIVILATAEAPQ
ncbi:hypothetical protein HYU92_01140 [Candidatus Curtissbacteria bacterium]|nr:hypothetical protein [Candidatus Curtissbacteria bacterium]